jgi:hypothetical protein
MGGMTETVARIYLKKLHTFTYPRAGPAQRSTVNRNYYDPDHRNRECCSPSLKLVLFRKSRVGLPFTKVNQVFKEAVEADLLHGFRRLHFFDRRTSSTRPTQISEPRYTSEGVHKGGAVGDNVGSVKDFGCA